MAGPKKIPAKKKAKKSMLGNLKKAGNSGPKKPFRKAGFVKPTKTR